MHAIWPDLLSACEAGAWRRYVGAQRVGGGGSWPGGWASPSAGRQDRLSRAATRGGDGLVSGQALQRCRAAAQHSVSLSKTLPGAVAQPRGMGSGATLLMRRLLHVQNLCLEEGSHPKPGLQAQLKLGTSTTCHPFWYTVHDGRQQMLSREL